MEVSHAGESVLETYKATPGESPGSTRDFASFKIALLVLVTLAGGYWAMGAIFSDLWQIWTTDGLRSIGMLIIPTSALLCFRAWEGFRLRADGEWWALGICAAALVLARIVGLGPIAFHLNLYSGVRVIPEGLVLWAYATGVVLFFFGRKAYRRAWFPIALLLFVNPVPMFFQRMVDLPLQYVGAATARSFASWLGTPLDPDRLKLMFSPSLGMFVAPGCDGLRGSVAMGYLTVTLGYLRGLPSRVFGIYVASAIFFAYLCNLLRLCALVLCYKVALSISFLAEHMVAADYVIGGLIFLGAAFMVFGWPVLLQRRFAQ